jgi:hypothetical protein
VLVAALSALLAAAVLVASGAFAPDSRADVNANDYDCRGHIEAGGPQPGDEDTQVKYKFGCSGPITGYQIQSDTPIGSFSTDAIALDGNGNAVTSDSFSCNGDIPGLSVNCVGAYSGVFVNGYESVTGQFAISGKLCDEPRVDRS